MSNYEILFACSTGDGTIRQHARIVALPDEATAWRVAYAMVGERVDADQTLDRIVRLLPTSRSAAIARTPDGYYAMWARIFRALRINARDVRFWYGADIGTGTNATGHISPSVAQSGEPEIVGFFPWPPHEDTYAR